MTTLATGMSLHPIDIAIPLAFLGLSVVIGFVRRKNSDAEEYMLMGRSLGLFAFVASLVCSWYGGILGVSEYSYRYGLSNWFVFGAPYYIHALIFACFIARRAHLTHGYSIPSQIERTYGSGAGRVAAAVIFLVTMPAAYLLMLAKLIAWVTGWDYPIALLTGTLFSTVYVYSGGLRSVVRTDLVQFAVMYGGFIMMVIWLSARHGGLDYLRSAVPSELFTAAGGQHPGAVLVWYFIAATTLVEPLFYERVYAARSTKIVLPGILISISLWALFDFTTTATGLYARALLPQLSDPAYAFPELASRVLPIGWNGFFLAALLAVVVSTVDSYSFIAASAVGRDLIWKSLKSRSEEDLQKWIRRGLVVSSVAAFLLALASDSIISLWHALGSVSAPALLIPTLSSWSSRFRFHSRFVIPAMISSGGIALAWRLWPNLSAQPGYWLGIEPIYAGLALSVIWYVVSLLTPRPGAVESD